MAELAEPAAEIEKAPASAVVLDGETEREIAGHSPLASVADAVRAGGRPLPSQIRAALEPAFGSDFSDVRVHTDAPAADAARAIGAQAYTVGRHIAFAAGRYTPDTARGQRLLAHELAHVAQNGHHVAAPQRTSEVDGATERAADTAAHEVGQGRVAPVRPVAGAASTLARKKEPPASGGQRRGPGQGVGEVIPPEERARLPKDADGKVLTYRIWGVFGEGDDLRSFAERAVNDWVRWRFGNVPAHTRSNILSFVFNYTSLGKLNSGLGVEGRWHWIGLSESTYQNVREISGELEAERELRAREKREADLSESIEIPDPATADGMAKLRDATPEQRVAMLRKLIEATWTGNSEEAAILAVLRSTPEGQAAELSTYLNTNQYKGGTLFAALDRVVDLGNNMELHAALTELHLRGEKKAGEVDALLDAPVLPWHDVMGAFAPVGGDAPVTFSATRRASDGWINVSINAGRDSIGRTDMPYHDELSKLPTQVVLGGGKAYPPNAIFAVHDYDEARTVVLRARDLVGFTHVGERKMLMDVATIASLVTPIGAARTVAGKAALIVMERVLPLYVLFVDEYRLKITEWWPNWGPKMIRFADIARMAMGAWGLGRLAVGGAKLFAAWRSVRNSRAALDAANTVPDAEKAAAQLEKQADEVIDAASEFQKAEAASTVDDTTKSAGGAKAADQLPLPEPPNTAAPTNATPAPPTPATGSGGGGGGAKKPPATTTTPGSGSARPGRKGGGGKGKARAGELNRDELTPDQQRQAEVLEEFAEAGKKGTKPAQPEGTQATGTTTKPPTKVLSDADVLAANLSKNLKRPPGHHAHHIVPKGMAEAEEAWDILGRSGVGINDAENGVWLPASYTVTNEYSTEVHATIHTRRYVKWITKELTEAFNESGPDGVVTTLERLRREIMGGKAIR